MKKILVILLAATTLFACNNTTGDNTTDSKSTNSGDLYFDYTIDGKEMHADAAANKTDTVFHLLTLAENDPALGFTIPHDMSKPSITPSGSLDWNYPGGSVTLFHYPEKDINSFSFNNIYPERTPVIPDAIVITSSEKQGEEARIITGTFNFKTYYEEYKGRETKQIEHVIKGKFRIKHKLSDGVM